MIKEKEIEMHAKVIGQVQGVGFRALTRMYALGQKLKGTVKNCKDGSVEIVAQGCREKLDELMRQIKETDDFDIADIRVEYFPPMKEYHTFSIESDSW